jgi:integrase/recombinase XerD
MATDFAVFLRRFLTTYLAGLRGCSPNTIASYRDAFKLLIAYFRDERSIPPGKLTLDCVNAAAITGFLDWLETSRGTSVSTQPTPDRDQFLCAWMQAEDPARMAGYQDILAIPAKKQIHPDVHHLTVEQTRRLLAQPDRSTRRGRRDATLLAALYDTAAGSKNSSTSPSAISDLNPPPWPPSREGPQNPPRPADEQHDGVADR